MLSLVQEVLRSGSETLASLEAKYAISAKRHGKYPQLVQLKYDQISSPFENPLVRECRGIILDEADGWRIVARPFDKFFNLGEGNAAEIDWSTAKPLEKLDGSLAIVYHYDGAWHMATSGTPDASGPVGDQGFTFRDLFWDTWMHLGYDQRWLDEKFTFMFELMTPYNRIVVPHPKNRLVLIGVRNREEGFEINVRDPLLEFNKDFEVVQEFDLHSPEAIATSFETIDGLFQEGYVVVDDQFRRVKIKHPRYVLYHHMVGSLTKKKVLDAVRKGESPEILTYFPTWQAEFDEMKVKLDAVVDLYERSYNQEVHVQGQTYKIREIPVQKDFALVVKDLYLNTAPFFAVRAGKSKDFREHFSTIRLEMLAEIIGLKGGDDVRVE